MRPERSVPKGFTLIELLVVVAIIALLLGILLPSLSTARRQARGAVCMSNMRQIIQAVVMYASENRDAVPQTMETSSGEPATVSWWGIDNYQTQLERYIVQNRGGVDRDGITRGKGTVWFDPGDPDLNQQALWGSFSDNGLLTGVGGRLSAVRRPSETVFATLRVSAWAEVVGVDPPNPLPVESLDDAFWSSEFFDMCLDPWAEGVPEAHPYHWSRGTALPPDDLFPSETYNGTWDNQIDGRFPQHPTEMPGETRYGAGRTPFSFVDGHVAMHRFEDTYAFPDANWWDLR